MLFLSHYLRVHSGRSAAVSESCDCEASGCLSASCTMPAHSNTQVLEWADIVHEVNQHSLAGQEQPTPRDCRSRLQRHEKCDGEVSGRWWPHVQCLLTPSPQGPLTRPRWLALCRLGAWLPPPSFACVSQRVLCLFARGHPWRICLAGRCAGLAST